MVELNHPPVRFDLKRSLLTTFLDRFRVQFYSRYDFPHERCSELLYDCLHLPDEEFYSLLNLACSKGYENISRSYFDDDLNAKIDAINLRLNTYVHRSILEQFLFTLDSSKPFPHSQCTEILFRATVLPEDKFCELVRIALNNGYQCVVSDSYPSYINDHINSINEILNSYDTE